MLLVLIFFIIIIIIASIKIKIFIQIKENKLELFIKFYIFGKILIGKINLNKMRTKNNKRIQEEIKKIDINKKELVKRIYKTIKQTNINLEYLEFYIDICTTDVILTSYSVAVLSNIITFLLKILSLNINYKKCSYKINPIYSDKKILNIKLNCIISTNLVHIISIIYRNMKEWRCDKNGRRASNRRAYGNCNE